MMNMRNLQALWGRSSGNSVVRARNSALVFPWSGCEGVRVCVCVNTEMCKNSIYLFVCFVPVLAGYTR